MKKTMKATDETESERNRAVTVVIFDHARPSKIYSERLTNRNGKSGVAVISEHYSDHGMAWRSLRHPLLYRNCNIDQSDIH